MTTFSAAKAAADFPVFKPTGAGTVAGLMSTFEIAAALAAADIVEFGRVPACDVIEGFLRGDDIDTGTEVFDFDMGHAGNDTDTADPDAFLNSGVITGDAITELKPVASIYMPFSLKDGPVALAETTMVQGVCNVAANAGGVGTLYAGVYFITS